MPKKEDKLEKIRDMVDAIIADKPEDAETAFHSYVVDKTKEMVHGEPEESDEENDIVDDNDEAKKEESDDDSGDAGDE